MTTKQIEQVIIDAMADCAFESLETMLDDPNIETTDASKETYHEIGSCQAYLDYEQIRIKAMNRAIEIMGIMGK